ncbi:MAG: octanoyltransferase [Deltaproteobacteria bacterium]|nr:octanoyltransferase [Deltaproteobacteria bacterium]
MNIIDLGRMEYSAAVETMRTTLQERINGEIPDTLLLCEHDPVYTIGRTRGAQSNVVAPGDVPVIEVSRGGDVTFHGPGQIVGYPIFQLPEHRHDLHGFMGGLEEMMIRTLAHFDVKGVRDDRNTGVWVNGSKIMAIGIGAKRWVTWHGFALNHTVDLDFFRQINPCGMDANLVTRMADHLDPLPNREAVTTIITKELMTWWEDWTAPRG